MTQMVTASLVSHSALDGKLARIPGDRRIGLIIWRAAEFRSGTSMRRIELVPLPPVALRALADSDLLGANLAVPISLGSFFISPEWKSTWQRRAAQVVDDPASEAWITRAIVDVELDLVVGRAGFHGPPDADGMVEVGYAVDPAFRRQGYARAALVALLKWAEDDEAVHLVRASIRPDNHASLALVRQYGFVEVGEQWDDEDGLEVVLEVGVKRK